MVSGFPVEILWGQMPGKPSRKLLFPQQVPEATRATDWLFAVCMTSHVGSHNLFALHRCKIPGPGAPLLASRKGGSVLAQEAGPELLVKLLALHARCLTLTVLLRSCLPRNCLLGPCVLYAWGCQALSPCNLVCSS